MMQDQLTALRVADDENPYEHKNMRGVWVQHKPKEPNVVTLTIARYAREHGFMAD